MPGGARASGDWDGRRPGSMPTVSGQSARELSHVANVVGSEPLAT